MFLCRPFLALAVALASADLCWAAEGQLAMVVTLFRHGDRSAIVAMPSLHNHPADWPEGFGQLTQRGMKQQFNVGTYFRQHYIESLGYLGPEYHHTEVYVRTTDVDRTHMSAQSQLAGWFRPKHSYFNDSQLLWQPIPVHTVPVEEDSLLKPYDDGNCPKFDHLRIKHRQNENWNSKRHSTVEDLACTGIGLETGCTVEEFVAQVGEKSGFAGMKLEDMWEVGDTLFCREQHNMYLPEWANQETEQGRAVYDTIQELDDWIMFEMFDGHEERRLTGGVFVKELISIFNKTIHHTDPYKKIHMYSAHDTTVASVLEALNTNHWRTRAPPYASVLVFELHNNSNHFSLQIRLKNESAIDAWDHPGHVLTLPGCDSECPFDTFQHLVEDIIPEDWEAECRLRASEDNNYTALAISLCATGAIVLVGIVFVALRQRRRHGTPYHRPLEVIIDDDELDSDEPAVGKLSRRKP